MLNNKKILIMFGIILPLLYSLQKQIDLSPERRGRIEDMKYLPSGRFLKGAALAYDEILGDLLWIKTVIYFGEHYLSNKQYEWLSHMLDVSTDLNPYFEYPYEAGGVMLAMETKEIDRSIALFKKGMKNVPQTDKRYWYLPFFLGFDYMYFKKDFAAAARYMEQAARLPGHPEYLPMLVTRLYANANDPEVAIAFLKEIYENTENEDMKRDIDKRIKEIIVERDIRLLEKARNIFRDRYGQYPDTLQELFKSGIINMIPYEPFGGKYYIDQKDGSIHSTMVEERLGVYID